MFRYRELIREVIIETLGENKRKTEAIKVRKALSDSRKFHSSFSGGSSQWSTIYKAEKNPQIIA